MNIVDNALKIATEAHKGTFRKFSFDEYVVHPIRSQLKQRN